MVERGRIGSRIIGIVYWFLSFAGVELEVTTAAGVLLLRAIFFLAGIAVMLTFVRQASKVEPFTTRR